MVVPYSTNQERNLNNANLSFPGKRRKNTIDNSNTFFSYFKKVEWGKMLTLAGNTAILQLGSQSKKPFASATKDDKNLKFLNFYLRLRTAWLFDLVELNFSFQQYPGAPSLQVSLNALTRVNYLPLETFFADIYRRRPCRNRSLNRKKIRSKEEQARLFTVARKLLLQNFYAGDASPSYVNANGETMLHVRP
jgi:hypothetical protein